MGKVLIIEDELEIAELERDYLHIAGFDADIETDGKEGLKKALTNDYDIYIFILVTRLSFITKTNRPKNK